MCKILCIPGLNPENKENNVAFMATMADLMSTQNDDGLGYAALDREGNMFGERWLFNHEAFDKRESTHTKARKIDKTKINRSKVALEAFVELEDETDVPSFQKFGQFGKVTDEISAVVLHARRATNTICYENTHPFVDAERQVAMIHNGVITNHNDQDQIRSTCDSERILNMYLKHNIDKNPMNMQMLIDDLKGWFACGIIAKDNNNKWIMDIFKNSQPNLGCAFVKELDAMVFSTDVNDIRQACRNLDFSIVSKSKNGVKDDMLCRFDAMTGNALMTLKYKDTRWNNQYYHSNFKHEAKASDDGYKEMIAKWEADKQEMERTEKEEENSRWNFIKNRRQNNVIEHDFNKTETRPGENDKQKEEELKQSGVTNAELRAKLISEKVEYYKNNGWDPLIAIDVATKQVAEDILRKQLRIRAEQIGKQQKWDERGISKYEQSLLRTNKLSIPLTETSKIAEKYDPLNEKQANEDGYTHSKESEIWIKRKTYRH